MCSSGHKLQVAQQLWLKNCGVHTLLGNLSLALQIALVSDNDDWKIVLVLDSQDLLLEGHDLLERLSAGDAVDQKETLAGAHVLLAHSRVLLLSGGIKDIEKGDLLVNDALLAVGIWEGRKLASLDADGRTRVRLRRENEPSIVGSYSSTK